MASCFRERLWQFILEYFEASGKSPAFADMTQAMGISIRSKSLISRSLVILAREGRLTLKREGRHLTIIPVKKTLPLLGRISAGLPVEAIAEETCMDLNRYFAGPDHYVLQVRGMSMQDEGIHDGDFIICKKADTASEGDIVIALIEQQNVTLKKISFRIPGRITLVPANPAFKPRAYLPESIRIQGIYQGLVRIKNAAPVI